VRSRSRTDASESDGGGGGGGGTGPVSVCLFSQKHSFRLLRVLFPVPPPTSRVFQTRHFV